MDLNKDIVIEILSLLPVKSLLRFRSVCKSWHNIIDSSTFTYFHLQNSLRQDDNTLFLQFSKSGTSQLSILEADNGKSHKGFFPAFQKFIHDNIGIGKVTSPLFVAGPVNGLICIYNKFPYIRSKRSKSLSIAIYNPCLDKIKILPVSPICSSLGLKYGKKNCNRHIGFGFDHVAKEYKIVQLITFPETGATCVEVYSGKTNTWRELATGSSLWFIDRIKGMKSKGVSWAHWRVEGEMGQCILSFNMQTEVFETTVLYPDLDFDFDVRWSSVVVFAKGDDDSVALFVSKIFDCHRWEVWELESGKWIHVRDVDVVPWKTKSVRFCCEIPNVALDTEMLHYTGSLVSP